MTVLLPFLGGFVGVWLASRFTANQSHADKVWHRKSEAYGHILEALEDIRDWYCVNLTDEMEQREPTPEVEKERTTLFLAARRKLQGTISREVWLLPDAVKQETDRLNDALKVRHESWFEHVDNCAFNVRQTRDKILLLAKADLRPPSFISLR
jgi:hypothetical protein